MFKSVEVVLDLVKAFNGDDLLPFDSMAGNIKCEQRAAMGTTDSCTEVAYIVESLAIQKRICMALYIPFDVEDAIR